MKIALVIQHADSMRGGAERYTMDLAAALIARSHEVSLLATSFATIVPQGAVLVNLDRGGFPREARYRRMLDALDDHLEQTKYDIVHSMLPVRRCDIYQPHAGIAAENLESGHLKTGGRIMQAGNWISNRFSPKRNNLAAIERALLSGPRPPIVLCLSDKLKQIMLEHYPRLGSNLVKLFNAVDLKRFDRMTAAGSRGDLRKKLAVSDDQILALLISQNWELKGVKQAIEALARIDDPRLVLAVVGKDRPGPYQALAKSLSVDDRVRFPGPTSNAPAFYAAADFFVLPTRSDVCSLVVLEALAMGLPVISTVDNGACEIMTDGKQGFILARADDVMALATAMKQMLDPQARTRMSAASLELRPELSYQYHLDRLIQIYEQRVGESDKLPAS